VVKCRDCKAEGITTARPAPNPGPRCATHWREVKKNRKALAHSRHVQKTYGITAEEYQLLYEGQGGLCFVCKRSRGLSRKLAVDHDHTKECGHDPKQGCRNCVRALLCQQCNTVVVGRYDIDALMRAVEVLKDPPAQHLLGGSYCMRCGIPHRDGECLRDQKREGA
jgi:hypothetical protein